MLGSLDQQQQEDEQAGPSSGQLARLLGPFAPARTDGGRSPAPRLGLPPPSVRPPRQRPPAALIAAPDDDDILIIDDPDIVCLGVSARVRGVSCSSGGWNDWWTVALNSRFAITREHKQESKRRKGEDGSMFQSASRLMFQTVLVDGLRVNARRREPKRGAHGSMAVRHLREGKIRRLTRGCFSR